MNRVLTVGHSTHAMEHFMLLLRQNDVTAVADVRSTPFSRHNPQFNQGTLQSHLKQGQIAYVYMGWELGARSDDPSHYNDGRVVYDRLARSARFQDGIGRVLRGAQHHRVALMCSEKDPLTCHRTILVARELVDKGVEVGHVMPDGTVQTHAEVMDRLMRNLGIDTEDFFATYTDLCSHAYKKQEEQVAYRSADIVTVE